MFIILEKLIQKVGREIVETGLGALSGRFLPLVAVAQAQRDIGQDQDRNIA